MRNDRAHRRRSPGAVDGTVHRRPGNHSARYFISADRRADLRSLRSWHGALLRDSRARQRHLDRVGQCRPSACKRGMRTARCLLAPTWPDRLLRRYRRRLLCVRSDDRGGELWREEPHSSIEAMIQTIKDLEGEWQMYRSALSAVGIVGLLTTAQAGSPPICRPTLAFKQIQFSEMQPPTLERKWSALVSVDASRCATNSGL